MLDDAEIFVQVVRAGSFSGASRASDIPVSTISDRIANLEARLGTILLKRTTRRLILTEAGQAYFDVAQKAVEEIRGFEADMMRAAPLATGKLRLASTLALDGILAPIITAYLRQYEGVSIELVMSARNEDLIGGRLDAAIRMGALPDDASLTVRVLGKSMTQLFASRDYLETVPPIQSPDDLIPADVLCFTEMDQLEMHDADGISTRIVLAPRFASNQMSSILRQAVAGCGVAVLPTALVTSELKAGTLAAVLSDWHCGITPINIVYPRHPITPAKVRSFIDVLVAHFPKSGFDADYPRKRKLNPVTAG